MPTSMGQTAVTLNRLLDMSANQTDGDTEELLEIRLQQARSHLVEAVQAAGDCSKPVQQLLQLKCHIQLKYGQLNMRQILKDNQMSLAELKAIPVALAMLEKYGRHLLKPPGARVDQWRQIKFNNPIFRDRVLPMKGALEVVRQMGYLQPVDSGLQFALDEPDPETTSILVADIVLARIELEQYLMGKHPHPEIIHAYLPESTIDQLLVYWDQMSGPEPSVVSISPEPSQPLQESQHNRTADEVEPETANPVLQQASETSGELLQSASHQQDDSLQRACDICGEKSATVWCRLCDNKQLCTACDDMWHRHPKRQNHERAPISSLPSPSSAPGTDAILGPFGIRAVHSLSSLGREKSPVLNGTNSTGNAHDSSYMYPPQYYPPTSPSSYGVQPQQQDVHLQHIRDVQASIQQHQQQLQLYQQQQLGLWQQEGQNMMNEQQTMPTCYLYSIRDSLPQESVQATAMQNREGKMYVANTDAKNSAFPPFPVLEPTIQQRHEDSAVSLAASCRQSSTHIPEPDYSLRTPQQSVVSKVGRAMPVPFSDISLRQAAVAESAKTFATGPVAESGVFSSASDRRNSNSWRHSSVFESSLLKTVLAEPDYEKRAAKCDVRLLTLEEDLQDVESKLDDFMLNTADLSESEEFMTLNRRKARLMKEHNTLSSYRRELADIIAAQSSTSALSGDSNHTSQVFHPPSLPGLPALGSFSSPIYPPDHSPTLTQLGFSYPHQASHSPLHAQEPVTQAGYQPNMFQNKGMYGNPFQSHVTYHSPNAQESMAHGAMTHRNSSVDVSSILPQWQMNPSMSAPSSAAVRNQMTIYPPPRYQLANTLSCVTQQECISPAAVSHASPHFGVPVNVSGFSHNQQDLNQNSSAPSLMNQVTLSSSAPQSGKDLIGFENLMLEMSHEIPVRSFAHTAQPSQIQLQEADKPLVSLTPLPAAVTQISPANQHYSKYDIPEQKWQCSHCTYINNAGTRVCSVCNRTSDKPILIQGAENMAESEHCGEDRTLKLSTAVEGVCGSMAAAGKIEVSHMSREQLAKFNSKIAEEQDQVYLEKKEAHKQYFESLQQQGQKSHLAEPSMPPTFPPPSGPSKMDVVMMTRPPVPPRKFPATPYSSLPQESKLESATAQFQSENSEKSGTLAAKPVLTESGLQQGTSSLGGNENSGDSSGVGSLDSLTILSKEGDFSVSMEKFSEQKKIKQQQMDGADLMHYIKMADRDKFQIEEMLIAASKSSGDYRQALEWLRTEWSKLVQVVVSSTRAEGQKLEQNDVGDLSAEEARRALRENQGDMVAAVRCCVARRKQLYCRLNPDGSFAREEVLQAMLQSSGDEETAREQLYSAVLQPFVDRIWERRDRDGQGGSMMGSKLLQMAMTEASSCQSVSTSVISHRSFQQTILDRTVERDRRVRMILVEGKLRSWGRADMVIKLLDVDLPGSYPTANLLQDAEPPYSLEDVVEAVRNCPDRKSAHVYLTQECSTCFSLYPMSKIRNLNFCQCKICSDCLKQNFEVVIREKHVRHWTCPICNQPDLNDTDIASEYLSFLGLLLHMQVDKEVFDLFETKVRDWHLQKDPNFRWCAHCGNGFIADEHHLRMVCPHCGDRTCYKCKRQWEDQHDGLTCEQFAQWKIDNDPNNQAVGLARHLEENGIDCPSCKMRYALAKGGCMHFKCPQCGHEFCSGCYQAFYHRGTCRARLKSCKSSGLHAHHPRDCFFYLRDEDVARLQSLLRDTGVQFNTVPPESQEDAAHCPVIEQKEFDSGKCDESCGKVTQDGHAGLCVTHYNEYLVGLINRNHIDPVVIMTVEEIKKLLKRADITCPKISTNELEPNYRKRLVKFVKEKIPLPRRGP